MVLHKAFPGPSIGLQPVAYGLYHRALMMRTVSVDMVKELYENCRIGYCLRTIHSFVFVNVSILSYYPSET